MSNIAELAAKIEITLRAQSNPTEFRGLLSYLYSHANGRQPSARTDLLKWFFKSYQYQDGEWHFINCATLH